MPSIWLDVNLLHLPISLLAEEGLVVSGKLAHKLIFLPVDPGVDQIVQDRPHPRQVKHLLYQVNIKLDLEIQLHP